mmetsp:Transcript_53187/g.154842  ORF Transcript_53187/g.154842 Transcript_53187/m.154842 type:complete len:303 (-) Transcript_53187:270-1178(-)
MSLRSCRAPRGRAELGLVDLGRPAGSRPGSSRHLPSAGAASSGASAAWPPDSARARLRIHSPARSCSGVGRSCLSTARQCRRADLQDSERCQSRGSRMEMWRRSTGFEDSEASWLSRSCGSLPASMRKRQRPTCHMSLHFEGGSPSSTSGAMVICSVDDTWGGRLLKGPGASKADPRSTSFSWQRSSETRTSGGFTSPCTSPLSWMWPTACSSMVQSSRAFSSMSRPPGACSTAAGSCRPWTSSSTKTEMPPATKKSSARLMCGCCKSCSRSYSSSASRWSFALGWITFSATCLPSALRLAR